MCKDCKCDRGFIGNRVKNLDNGRQYVDWFNSSVFILCTKEHIILSKQKRAGDLDKGYTLGTFGGYVEKGESYEQTMLRELNEETSLDSSDILYSVPVFYDRMVSEGITTERSSGFIVFLKDDINIVISKLKCNDSEEDVQFHIERMTPDIIRKYDSSLMPSLRCELLIKEALLISANVIKPLL